MVSYLFDRSFASAVVNTALAYNTFDVPFVKSKRVSVCFVAGQPLGFLSRVVCSGVARKGEGVVP